MRQLFFQGKSGEKISYSQWFGAIDSMEIPEWIGHDPVTLQRSVSWGKQSHMDGKIISSEMNAVNISHAVLFNLVTGRRDGDARNSVLDENLRIWGVDNEYIGFSCSNSWLYDSFSDMKMAPKCLQTFLQQDSSVLNDIFELMRCFGAIRRWDEETCKWTADPYEENIMRNFSKLQSFLSSRVSEEEISVAKLVDVMRVVEE